MSLLKNIHSTISFASFLLFQCCHIDIYALQTDENRRRVNNIESNIKIWSLFCDLFEPLIRNDRSSGQSSISEHCFFIHLIPSLSVYCIYNNPRISFSFFSASRRIYFGWTKQTTFIESIWRMMRNGNNKFTCKFNVCWHFTEVCNETCSCTCYWGNTSLLYPKPFFEV